MSESQPDMLGGKAVSGSRLARVRIRRKAKPARIGHAAPMGTGPAGETCGSCTYCEVFHYRKTYHKCRARDGDHWKGGRATDIRPMDPACSKFERLGNMAAATPHKIEAPLQMNEGAVLTPETISAVLDHLRKTRPAEAAKWDPKQMTLFDGDADV